MQGHCSAKPKSKAGGGQGAPTVLPSHPAAITAMWDAPTARDGCDPPGRRGRSNMETSQVLQSITLLLGDEELVSLYSLGARGCIMVWELGMGKQTQWGTSSVLKHEFNACAQPSECTAVLEPFLGRLLEAMASCCCTSGGSS